MGRALDKSTQEWYDDLDLADKAKIDSAPKPEVIAQMIVDLEDPRQFDMNHWAASEEHLVNSQGENMKGCGFALCMAGWAAYSAGYTQKEINFSVSDATYRFLNMGQIGRYLLELNYPDSEIFFRSNSSALEFIKDRWGVERKATQ